MAKSKQLRVQLSFRRGDEDHQRAFRYLKSRADRTNYIVKLIQADLLSQAIQQGEIVNFGIDESVVPEIDYGKLIEELQPTLDMLVAAAVAKAINSLPPVDRGVESAAEPAEKTEPQSEELSFALEGLSAFAGFGPTPEGGEK